MPSIKMKLLIVGLNGQVGGIETLFYSLFKEPINDIEVSIVTFDVKCAYESKFEDNGYTIYHLPSRKKAMYKFNGIVRSFYENHNQFDYIWINTASNSMYQFQYYGKRLTKAKIITHSHGTAAYMGTPTIWSVMNNILNVLNRRIVRNNSDFLFACSRAAGLALFGDYAENDIIVLKNGIDTNSFQYNFASRKKIRDELEIKNQTLVVGMIGRLSSQKNPIKGIDVFAQLNKHITNSILLVCGAGDLEQEVNGEICKKGIGNSVRMLGVRNDINSVLSAIDILLMPSLFEGLPIACIEAQCNGVQCFISTAITNEVAVTDLVHFIDIKKDDHVWCDEIMKAIHSIDRKKYAKIIENCGYDIKRTRDYVHSFLCEGHK